MMDINGQQTVIKHRTGNAVAALAVSIVLLCLGPAAVFATAGIFIDGFVKFILFLSILPLSLVSLVAAWYCGFLPQAESRVCLVHRLPVTFDAFLCL
ncbi:MAG: hypothetical protein LBT46_06450 [Planctomycetaceae bacterium]|jgi:hypothetical protein|nr:hypothetical protein [Planctomycetaceae bacterium]